MIVELRKCKKMAMLCKVAQIKKLGQPVSLQVAQNFHVTLKFSKKLVFQFLIVGTKQSIQE